MCAEIVGRDPFGIDESPYAPQALVCGGETDDHGARAAEGKHALQRLECGARVRPGERGVVDFQAVLGLEHFGEQRGPASVAHRRLAEGNRRADDDHVVDARTVLPRHRLR